MDSMTREIINLLVGTYISESNLVPEGTSFGSKLRFCLHVMNKADEELEHALETFTFPTDTSNEANLNRAKDFIEKEIKLYEWR